MKRGDQERSKVFNRRVALLGGGQALLVALLAGRMYELQVLDADRYTVLAEENRINMRLLPPPRGWVVDRFGRPLAVNRKNYRVVVIAEQAGDVEAVLATLSRVVDLNEGERERVLREVRRRRSFVPVLVKENLAWQDVARIEVNAPDLPGVQIEVGETRDYPHGEALAHIIGYVAAVSEREQTGDPLLELPNFRIGKNGIEKHYDLALRGSAGTMQVEVNAVGRVIRELSRNDGDPGQEVALTLDLDLQTFIHERLGNESAGVAVIDVHSGEIRALVSTPSFDPNPFVHGISSAAWRELTGNERAPLINKAIGGQYPPGSTYKTLVALAALEAGIAADQRVYCPGHTDLGSHRFHCWKRGGHGHMNMIDALRESCDVYFYDVARRVGIERIAEMSHKFGLGHRLGIDLPGERAGLVPTPDWKRGSRDEPWLPGDTLNASIGQGYMLTTPLQLAVMTARMVNGGRAVVPHLARRTLGPDGRLTERAGAEGFPAVGVSEAHLAVVREGMNQVVNHGRGTARRSAIDDPDWLMAGKTGTVQVRRITMAERMAGIRRNEDRPWKHRDHALFIGYAPAADPRYAVAVVIEHGGGGSSAAAPVASDILQEMRRLDQTRGVIGATASQVRPG